MLRSTITKLFYYETYRLHSSGEEGGISEDVEYILGCGNEECFSLFDADAVDVGFAPEAHNDHEGVGMEVDLCGYLYDDAVDGEVRAVDEFRVRFGGVVGGTILGPDLVVDRFLGLLDMKFAGFALGIDTPEVIDAIGDVGRLLDLDEEVTGAYRMESSGRQEIEISLVRLMGGNNVKEGVMGYG